MDDVQTSESPDQELVTLVPDITGADESENRPFRAITPQNTGNTTDYDNDPDLDVINGGQTMTVIEHLDELRTRLLRCIAYVLVAFCIALCFTKDIISFLEQPAGNVHIQALSIEEPLVVFFKVAFYVSLIMASPLLLFELSRFVEPGLTRKERSVLAPVVIGGPILFVCGGFFAYKCLLPPMLHFFSAFGQGVAPINQRLDFYISLVSSILLYMGLCFQMPIIIFALAMAGVVTSNMLIKIWRYAVFATAFVACVITPDPTAFSMLIVMAALNGLYLLSIILLKFARK